ncbi:MAG: DUF4469 domain-containing protein [Treponema sp.]|nr:DUF4469 domain-containing protein [Treponema sp.]
MPRKKPDLLSVGKQESAVDITIRKNNLKAEGRRDSVYGSVEHRKISVRAILKEIEEKSSSAMSRDLMFYMAQELSRRMMEKLRQGYAVELLDFGTIYPTLKGSLEEDATRADIRKHFDVGFSPSREAKKAVGSLVVGDIHKVRSQHDIFSVTDLFNRENPEGTVTENAYVRIRGKALKLGGSQSALYAVRLNDDFAGETAGVAPDVASDLVPAMLPPREDWIRQDRIYTNKPSCLEFCMEGITKGNYVFVVETSLSAGGKSLKQSVSVHSGVIRVVEKI